MEKACCAKATYLVSQLELERVDRLAPEYWCFGVVAEYEPAHVDECTDH